MLAFLLYLIGSVQDSGLLDASFESQAVTFVHVGLKLGETRVDQFLSDRAHVERVALNSVDHHRRHVIRGDRVRARVVQELPGERVRDLDRGDVVPQFVHVETDLLLRPVSSQEAVDFDLLEDSLKQLLASDLLGLEMLELGNGQTYLSALLNIDELCDSLFLRHVQLEASDEILLHLRC